MARYNVSVKHSPEGLSFHFTGPNVAKADTKLLTDCWNALLECAEQNNCFEKGFGPACLATIARHDSESHCVTKAFGFAAAS